jgi:carbon-monoxide dehydrogenase medium subunit
MTSWVHPERVEDVVAELAGAGGVPAAGCTRLAFALADPARRPRRLVSLDRVAGLAGIERRGDVLVIGATTRHATVAADPAVRAAAPVLAETFARVGNPRIRNVATVGGVLAGAVYAWDPPTVLHALGARVRITGPAGDRVTRVEHFYPSPGVAALGRADVITAIELEPPAPGVVGRYQPFRTRSVEDTSCLGVAVLAGVRAGRCASMRIAVGSGTPRPVSLPTVDAGAVGRPAGDPAAALELARDLADAYADRVECVDDLKGGAAYRRDMVRVWVRRTVEAVLLAAPDRDAA